MAEQSATTSKDEQKLSIPVSTIFNPIYTHDLYKLPAEPIKYWLEQGIHIRRCIGEGAFAAAYEGYYEKNAKLPAGKEKFCGKDFAVKVHHVGYHPYVPGMPNKDKIDEETMNEMAFANRTDLVHPNIIEFHFTAQYPLNPQTVCDHVFIFMERAMFPLQELLNVLMKMKAQVPSSVGIHWIRSMASGIQHLHSIGLAHNDLHSYNIFVFGDAQPDGNCFKLKNIQVKLADFGKCTDISKESEAGKALKSRKTSKDFVLCSYLFATESRSQKKSANIASTSSTNAINKRYLSVICLNPSHCRLQKKPMTGPSLSLLFDHWIVSA